MEPFEKSTAALLMEAKEDNLELLTLLDIAWGIIANADWEAMGVDYVDAAIRWRDSYHKLLNEKEIRSG